MQFNKQLLTMWKKSSGIAIQIKGTTLQNYHSDAATETLKSNKFSWRNNNSAPASRLFVHIFAVPARLQREMAKF